MCEGERGVMKEFQEKKKDNQGQGIETKKGIVMCSRIPSSFSSLIAGYSLTSYLATLPWSSSLKWEGD